MSFMRTPAEPGRERLSDSVAPSVEPGRDAAPSQSWRGLLKEGASRTAIIWIWGLMILGYSLGEPHRFFEVGTFQTIFSSQQPLVFLTLGLMCTMLVGEFVDLSVTSVFGLTATMIPVLVVNNHWDVALASVVSVLAAVVCGVANAVLVVIIGVDTIIVTLGSSALILGITLWISNLGEVVGLSSSFGSIALHPILGLPISFYYGIALVLLFAYFLGMTPTGRRMRFVGANREVARLSGVRVNRIRFGAFVVGSLLCGIGGMLTSAGIGGFDPNSSGTYLTNTIATLMLGTAVIQPGRFNPVGTWIAIYFLATGILGLELLGLAGWVSDVFYGGSLVVAVGVANFLRRRLA